MNTCTICGQQFVPAIWRPKARTCSIKCNQRRQDARRRESRLQWKPDGPSRPCVTCGTEFVPLKYGGKRQLHCSALCRGRAANRAASKRNPHQVRDRARRWKLNGNWKLALERDNHTCQICGAQKKRLTVHHRDGSGEDTSPNHDLDNLMSLCYSCHNKLHRVSFRIIDGELYVLGAVFGWFGTGDTVKVLKGDR